jgi:hypothetical protein
MGRYPPDVATYDQHTKNAGVIIHGRLHGTIPAETWHAWYRRSTPWFKIPFERVFHKCDSTMSVEEINIMYKFERMDWRLEILQRATAKKIENTAADIRNTLRKYDGKN